VMRCLASDVSARPASIADLRASARIGSDR